MGEVLQPQGTSMGARTAKAGREQVLAAADGILWAGQRPTIEAIQARLGGGSPNSIVAYLKEWYSELGERLAHVEAPAEGLLPDVHRAALALQRAIQSNQNADVESDSTDSLIRSLRAEVASQKLLLDEVRAQRGRDQQALADARALLMQKDDQLQELQAGHGAALTRIALLEQRLRRSPSSKQAARRPGAARAKAPAPRTKAKALKKKSPRRVPRRPKRPVRKPSGRR